MAPSKTRLRRRPPSLLLFMVFYLLVLVVAVTCESPPTGNSTAPSDQVREPMAINSMEKCGESEFEFECSNRLRCIDARYLCDGDDDCGDGSDEASSPGSICEKVTCRSDHFRCDSNRCIFIHWVCDDERDCLDGSDEEPIRNCRNVTCSAAQFTCKTSGRCIPLSWSCDSDYDCGPGDTSDEHDNCAYPECEGMEFRCKNKRCVPLDYLCDGDDDCRDGSDEMECEISCNGAYQFSCDQGQKCLHTAFRCNGVWDCEDGSDEEHCFSIAYNKTFASSPLGCHKEEFKCHSGGCVHKTWLCDGKKDCFDGSDEISCGMKNKHTCEESEFRCKSDGFCIPMSNRCDGKYNDCADNSDEKNCTFKNTSRAIEEAPACLSPSKQCISVENKTTTCLDITRFCDKTIDCVNGTDEGEVCQEDHCHFALCKGLCQNMPHGYECYCPKGLRLAVDSVTCTDIMPCSEWGVCSQRCVQLKTHHKCECEEGYKLETDGYTCKSVDSGTPYIIFSNRHQIRSVDLHTMSVRPLISGLKNTIALDFFHSPEEDTIFWTDVMDDKIYRGAVIHGSLINIEAVVQTGLATAEGLAVDWIGKNLYWVESNLDQIEVAKLNGSFRRTLVAGDMESPRAIALDPRLGLMFWTDWDSDAPRIERASMSGEERQVVFGVDDTDGAWPNGLTLDYMAYRIYWIDARSDSIHTVKYDGSDHHEVLRGHELLTHPFAIALFGNYVYWTDWRTNSVIRANKWNGTDIRVVQRAVTQPFDIQIYHSSRQPLGIGIGPCTLDNGGCSHLCLLSINNTRTCKCPHVMKLDVDNKTCLTNEVVLLFSRPHEIRGIDLLQPYYNIIPPISVPKVIQAGQLDFMGTERRIYWADSQLNEVKRANLTGGAVETIIDTIIEHPLGLAIDWVSGNIFVTSQETNSNAKIYVCNLNGEYISEVINQNLSSPESLAVHPFEGWIIWADHGQENDDTTKEKEAYIGMAAMDGSERRVLINTTSSMYVDRPSSLQVDFSSSPNRLYWVNVGSATIQWLDLKTLVSRIIWQDSQNTHSPLEPLALSVYLDEVLFSSQINNSIHIISKDDGSNHKLLRNHTDDIIALRVYDKLLQKGTNLCQINNGNCSHLCLPISVSRRICKCAIGFKQVPDNETDCIGSDLFLIYSWNWGLKGVSIEPNSTGEPMLPPISKVFMANRIDFSCDKELIYWVDSDDGSITRIRRDTTGYQTIVHGQESIEGIAIDWIANNIYWLDPSYDVIEVARLNGSNRYVILSGDMDKPNSIAVHPIKGYLFWSDVGIPGRIERALLDGTERTVLLNESIQVGINNIAIDFDEDMIYWCDSRADTIERMDLNGGNREIVLKDESIIQSPISITIYENFIYWADTNYQGGSILKADKSNLASNSSSIIVLNNQMGDHIKDIQIYHKRMTTEDNPCAKNNGGCQDLCLYKGNRVRRCICAHGMLSKDGSSCEPYEAFIMFSKVLEIDSIHIDDENNLNSPLPTISSKEHMRNIIGLTFDYRSQRVIYSDIQKGSINSIFFNGTDHKVIIEKQGSVEGVAYDQVYGDLYWTSNSDASISCLNLRRPGSKYEKIIKLTSDDKPRGIAVDSCASRVYWTNWNTKQPSIQRAYLSGYDVHNIITTDIRMPNALTLDHKLQNLFWSDARLDKIERCNLDGTKRVVILHEVPQHPFDVTVFGDYVFWTDWVAHAVYRANKYTGQEVIMLRRNVPRPMGIVAIANETEDCTLNPCLSANSECSDICSVSLNGTVVCSCYAGRVLLPDGNRCAIKESNCSSAEFECGTGTCIPFELTCDGLSACPDNSDEALSLCIDRKCPDDFFRCPNDKCIPMAKLCDGAKHCPDNSDEANCSCADDQFRCNDGTCIGKRFRCDHDPDCAGKEDEADCHNHSVSASCDLECKHGGQCEMKEKQPHCKCPAGWNGTLCEIEPPRDVKKDRTICAHFCRNGGTCSLPNRRELPPMCSCPQGWTGDRCQLSTHCNGFCFNGGTCLNTGDPEEMPLCMCTASFTGARCENFLAYGPGVLNSQSDSQDGNTSWILLTVIPITLILIVVLILFVGAFACRFRKRSRAFMHRRMEDPAANVEISNPMFGGDEFDEDTSPSDALSRSFSIEVDEKSTNFTNPMYEYQRNLEDEKKTLLVSPNDTLSPSLSEPVEDAAHPDKGSHPLA